MKAFLLYVEILSLSISGVLVNQMDDVNQSNNHNIEIEKFLDMYKKVLDNLKTHKSKNKQNKQRQEIIEKFGENEDILKLQVNLIL